MPKLHIVHSESKERLPKGFRLSSLKKLTEAFGLGYKATKFASGDILIEIRDKGQLSKLSNIASFGEIPVTLKPQRPLSTVCGVIFDTELIYLTEEEILEGLKAKT